RRCLAKDPEERYQTIKDVAIELKEVRREMNTAGINTTAPPTRGETSDYPLRDSEGATGSSPAALLTRPSSAEYVLSGIKQHKLAAAITILVLIIAAAGFGIYLHARNTEVAIESIVV